MGPLIRGCAGWIYGGGRAEHRPYRTGLTARLRVHIHVPDTVLCGGLRGSPGPFTVSLGCGRGTRCEFLCGWLLSRDKGACKQREALTRSAVVTFRETVVHIHS